MMPAAEGLETPNLSNCQYQLGEPVDDLRRENRFATSAGRHRLNNLLREELRHRRLLRSAGPISVVGDLGERHDVALHQAADQALRLRPICEKSGLKKLESATWQVRQRKRGTDW